MPHILVVDDDPDIRRPLERYLTKYNMRVTCAENGIDMRQKLEMFSFDLVLLDIMMPGEDGLSLCRHVQHKKKIPVILLTALSDDTDKVIGLEMGADAYISKPFNPRVLLANIKAVLRRSESLPPQSIGPENKKASFADWKLDLSQQELIDSNGLVTVLSSAELRMLNAFITNPHTVLNRDQLLDLTHGREAKAFERSIDNMISRLRKKIEQDSASPKLIKTVRGGGYMFASDVSFN